MDNCTIDCIQIIGNFSYQQTCNFVKEQCIQDSVQFVQAYYCTFHQSFFLLVILGIIFFIFFYLALNALTQHSLTPCVQNVITRFKISPTLAGITFLAFANGSPDVLTAILAGSSSSSSTALIPFGSIFGGLLFSTSFVLSAVIFQSPNQRFVVKKQQIILPLSFYIFGILFLMIVSIIYGKMNIYLALVLIFAYLIFMSFVLKSQKKRRRQHIQSLKDQKLQDQIIVSGSQKNIQQSQQSTIQQSNINKSFQPNNQQNKEQQQKGPISITIQYIERFYQQALLWVIPPRDNKQWSPVRSILSMSISPFILALSQDVQQSFESKILGVPIIVFLTIPAIIFIIHISICCFKGWKPIQSAYYTIYAFLVTIAWLTLVIGVLINLLELIQLLTNINPVFLGLTLIAWANTIGDYLSITAFAKKGRASTAVSGVFSGQLFNFLIGFGASLSMQSSDGQFQFEIFSFSGDTYEIISDSIIVFIITAGLVFLCIMFYKVISLRGIFNRGQAVILRGFYFVVLIISLGLSISTDFFRNIVCDIDLF